MGQKETATALAGKTVGDRIKAAMEHAQLSKSDLVRATGVSFQSVSAWVTPRGKRSRPSAENLHGIAEATGVALRWLQTGEGDPFGRGEATPRPPYAAWTAFLEEEGSSLDPWIIETLASVRFAGLQPTANTYGLLARALRMAKLEAA